jgi:hypothetical protein
VRWDELFADLEAQAHAFEALDRSAEVADRTRAELARVPLASRLHHAVGREVRVAVTGAGEVVGRLRRVGADWLLVTTPDEVVVTAGALTALWNLPEAATAPTGISSLVGRSRITAVLRAIARDRSPVSVTRRDGGVLVGTPDRIGADWFDLAVHAWGATARRSEVRSRVTMALDQLATVSRGPAGWD